MESFPEVEIVEGPSRKLICLSEIAPRKRMRDLPEKDKIPSHITLMLAKNHKNEDPTGWWISEKLDGVRCYWNGFTFMSRQGKHYTAPDFFVANLPSNMSLDGELWLGRKMFQECVSIARCTDNGKNDMDRWHRMKYMVFDVPSLDLPFEDRIGFLYCLVKNTQNPYLNVVEQIRCESLQHMCNELEKVENKGGEGIMLRKPGSFYQGQRSNTLLKVKNFLDDEATVIGYEEGKGKYTGSIGALKVKGPRGRHFKIGSGLTDLDRRNPPPIGTKITYRYQELSNDGVPRFPTYYRKFLT